MYLKDAPVGRMMDLEVISVRGTYGKITGIREGRCGFDVEIHWYNGKVSLLSLEDEKRNPGIQVFRPEKNGIDPNDYRS